MNKLTVSIETFGIMLLDIIKSGVSFTAKEVEGNIVIEFNGGF